MNLSKRTGLMTRRQEKKGYFDRVKSTPSPLTITVKRRVKFSEVDVMGIVWYGRHASFFEEATAELGRRYGLSYKDFYSSKLRAPIVQLHIDYYNPLYLDEEFEISASLIWHEGARLNTEYMLTKSGGDIAATGYTVQVFTDATSGEPCIVLPELLERCHKKWRSGEFE